MEIICGLSFLFQNLLKFMFKTQLKHSGNDL